ncbi:tubulin binding cofactor A [Biscogniauxia mediterranea]|nr:tubulin binding cofactor A [Biscogniauxia mediterranea]
MAPGPSPLVILTQAVQRLVKENNYYLKELSQQTERVARLEKEQTNGAHAGDDNAEFVLKQEKKALEETKAVFAPLHERISDSVQRLEEQLAASESEGGPADEISKAKEALKLGRSVEPPVV